MTKPRDAVVAGHICLDLIPPFLGSRSDWKEAFQPGRLLKVGPVISTTGGAVSNTGRALHKLGVSTHLMGKVGDDLLGQAILQVVRSQDPVLAEGMIVDAAVDSSYTVVINPPGVDRIFLHCPGANDTFTADDVNYEIVGQTRLFHFGYPPLMSKMFERAGIQLKQMFQRVKAAGVTTSLDMAFPDPASPAGEADWTSILGQTLPHVDIFTPNVEEITYMLDGERHQRLSDAAGDDEFASVVTPEMLTHLSDRLLDMGCGIVGLKLGARGFYVRTGGRDAIAALGRAAPSETERWANRELWAPCFEVEVKGTTGAGDATTAGFLAGLLADLSPVEAATSAVAVGGCAVEAADTLKGIRPWDEIWQRVKRGWARRPLQTEDNHWRRDQQSVWTREE